MPRRPLVLVWLDSFFLLSLAAFAASKTKSGAEAGTFSFPRSTLGPIVAKASESLYGRNWDLLPL